MSKGWMITGTSSGSGKTTITIALLRALKNKGYSVQPYKCGPDYIDPMFHKMATGHSSYSLDGWMLKEEKIKEIFYKNIQNSDIGIIEGVMGYYDGLGVELDCGSSYQIAKMLKIPSLLVVDGSKSSTSVAAIVKGFLSITEKSYIKGIIVNKVSGEKHYQLVKTAIERYNDVECYGYMKKLSDISFESRHLGLIPTDEIPDIDNDINSLANEITQTIDLDKLYRDGFIENYDVKEEKIKKTYNKRIAIAKDKAFNFYYPSNIDLLKSLGIELVEFSPLKDSKLPANIDGLYLGGGYPEVYAKELEENKSIREDIRLKIENGLPVYAECGGLMYLTNSIENKSGDTHKMVGVIDANSQMTSRLQHFGYVEVSIGEKEVIKGHEFHYSKIQDNAEFEKIYKVYKRRENEIVDTWECGYHINNILASYVHINFESNREFLYKMLDCIK